jgi:hypothetical protein
LTDPKEEAIIGTEVGWKRGERKGRGGGRGGKKRKTLRRPCKDETRFQGIATAPSRAQSSWPTQCLQGRDPFSGDCDYLYLVHQLLNPHFPCKDETRFQGIATLPDRRPPQPPRAPLARTRPVFRGLRRSGTRGPEALQLPSCKDETRFQGIATRLDVWVSAGNKDEPCKDETRFQGIATGTETRAKRSPRKSHLQGRDPFSGDCDAAPRASDQKHMARLARTRPVFRGLRPVRTCIRFACPFRILQGRDPFSGDCDQVLQRRRGSPMPPTLQGRDPFSGDCDLSCISARSRASFPTCKDETRFQGIATRLRPLPVAHLRHNGLQGRDPFSGDCDPGKPRRSLRFLDSLARTRPVFRGLRQGISDLLQPVLLHLAGARPVFRGLRHPFGPAGSRLVPRDFLQG